MANTQTQRANRSRLSVLPSLPLSPCSRHLPRAISHRQIALIWRKFGQRGGEQGESDLVPGQMARSDGGCRCGSRYGYYILPVVGLNQCYIVRGTGCHSEAQLWQPEFCSSSLHYIYIAILVDDSGGWALGRTRRSGRRKPTGGRHSMLTCTAALFN